VPALPVDWNDTVTAAKGSGALAAGEGFLLLI
jgi:hypothetical protein